MTHFDPYIPLALWVPLALAAAGLLAAYALTSRGRMLGRSAGQSSPDGHRRGRAAGRPAQSNLDGPRAASAGQAAIHGAGRRLGQHGRPRCPRSSSPAIRRPAGSPRPWSRTWATVTKSACGVRRRSSPTGSRPWRRSGPTGGDRPGRGHRRGLGQRAPQGQAVLLLSDGGHNVGGGTARLRDTPARAKSQRHPSSPRSAARPRSATWKSRSSGRRSWPSSASRCRSWSHCGSAGDLARQTRLSLHLAGKELESRMAKLIPDGAREEVFQVSQKASPGCTATRSQPTRCPEK